MPTDKGMRPQVTWRNRLSAWLLGTWWQGWQRWVAWGLSVGCIGLLGAVRVTTDAEYAFASLAIFPVIYVAWFGGLRDGLAMAGIGALMWGYGDLSHAERFSALWIPIINSLTRLATFGVVAVLAAQVGRLLRLEYQRAVTDGLTGLANHRAFMKAGNDEVVRAQRYEHPVAVLFLDLDNFKQLNDSRGHEAGDAALRLVARALRGALRATDILGRLGGDEFAIILPEINYENALETSKKIVNAVSTTLVPFAPVGVSAGLAWFELAESPFPTMLRIADEAMYAAKGDKSSQLHVRHNLRVWAASKAAD